MRLGESFILRAVVSFLFFLINLFAVYLLLRGHNLPGGGFIGGLGSALSFVLLSLARGVEETQRMLGADPVRIAATGLLVALLTGVAPLVVGEPFLRHFHFTLDHLPVLGALEVGTPLLFDVGVFLVVIGVTTKLLFLLSRSVDGMTALVGIERERYAAAAEEPAEKAPSAASRGRADE